MLKGYKPPDGGSLEVENIPLANVALNDDQPDQPFISPDKPDPVHVPPFKLPLRVRSGIDNTSNGTGTCVKGTTGARECYQK